MVKIVSASEAGLNSGKPLEDAYFGHVFNRDGKFAAGVFDGVSQRRLPDGSYPSEVGFTAARCAADCLSHYFDLGQVRGSNFNRPEVESAVLAANRRIRVRNEEMGSWDIDDYVARNRSSTTMVMAWGTVAPQGLHVEVLSVGDSLVLSVSPGGMRIHNRDQVHACREWGVGKHGEQSPERRRQKAENFCNNPDVRHPETGEPNFGYGVLNGDERVARLIEYTRVRLLPESLLILASDALRVLSRSLHPDDPLGYQHLADLLLQSEPEKLPKQLIKIIRAAESEKGVRSDDATVVLVCS